MLRGSKVRSVQLWDSGVGKIPGENWALIGLMRGTGRACLAGTTEMEAGRRKCLSGEDGEGACPLYLVKS